MDEIDEKLRDVYDRIDKATERVETRITIAVNDKIAAVKNLLDISTTARHETIVNEFGRIDKEAGKCLTRCSMNVDSFNKRINALEEDTHARADCECLKLNIGGRVQELETWKKMNWQRTIIYATTAMVAVIQIISWLSTMYDKIPKGTTPKVPL